MSGGTHWEEFAPEETATIRALAAYAEELFPGGVHWQVSEQLFAFEVRGARRRIWVALDQWIVLEVGFRRWELPYEGGGEAVARQVLLKASR